LTAEGSSIPKLVKVPLKTFDQEERYLYWVFRQVQLESLKLETFDKPYVEFLEYIYNLYITSSIIMVYFRTHIGTIIVLRLIVG
jgi:hypothetical protein